MYQIDNSTAVAAIPASTAPGTTGYFTDGNPATGVSATILNAEFMNSIMMENLNVLAAAGITPVKSQFNQLALAIAKIVQNGAAGAASETSAGILKLATSALAAAGLDNATAITPQKLAAQIQSGGLAFGVDTGTANTYVCTFSPALTARIEGQVRGLGKMVEEDRGCAEILTQVAALRAALDSIGSIVVTNHVEHLAGSEGFGQDKIESLKYAIQLFLK